MSSFRIGDYMHSVKAEDYRSTFKVQNYRDNFKNEGCTLPACTVIIPPQNCLITPEKMSLNSQRLKKKKKKTSSRGIISELLFIDDEAKENDL